MLWLKAKGFVTYYAEINNTGQSEGLFFVPIVKPWCLDLSWNYEIIWVVLLKSSCPMPQVSTASACFWQNDESMHELEVTDITQDEEKVSPANFELLKVLGQGSFGKVSLVDHRIWKWCIVAQIITLH